jgi:hypothetical protein
MSRSDKTLIISTTMPFEPNEKRFLRHSTWRQFSEVANGGIPAAR